MRPLGAFRLSQVTYWRERNLEVDFVLQRGDALVAIEVKSGGRKETLPGSPSTGSEALSRAKGLNRVRTTQATSVSAWYPRLAA